MRGFHWRSCWRGYEQRGLSRRGFEPSAILIGAVLCARFDDRCFVRAVLNGYHRALYAFLCVLWFFNSIVNCDVLYMLPWSVFACRLRDLLRKDFFMDRFPLYRPSFVLVGSRPM